MTIGEKVRVLRKQKGLTQEELAEKLGYKSRTSINKIEMGERDIPRSMIKKIAEILEVPAIELLDIGDPVPEPQFYMYKLPRKVFNIPIYESVSAGYGTYADNTISGHMPMYDLTEQEAAETLLLRVRGDSMYPRIPDGSLIQVHKQDFAESGSVAVVLIDNNEAVVKKFYCDSDKEVVRLESFNPEYPPRVFKGKYIMRLRVIGVATRVISEL